MAQKPGIPKGTRDFSPAEVAKRQYIISAIKHHFETFGFQPIETPSFENSDTLMGKYGEEGDRLIFKILNSGDYLKDFKDHTEITYGKNFERKDDYYEKDVDGMPSTDGNVLNIDSKKLLRYITEKALRYDLTVPFARYVVMHQNEIEFPFRRYQIQPVWRADKPQKGRYREFYQCDADVVGSKSLWQEVELVQLYDNVFTSLGLKGATIKINNRKVLSGIAEVIGASDKLIDFTVALDKLDKIGGDGVKAEMLGKGITEDAIVKVQPLFSFTGTINEKLDKLAELLAASEEGMKGVEELRFICDNVTALGMGDSELDLDVTLARGLNYYTGAIFEVAAPKEVALGSIGGGGRYDDLTGIFGMKNVSGVGISFGLDRIYLVLEQLGLFPDTVTEATKILFINFGNKEALYAMQAITKLRKAGVKAELYPDAAKIGKQFQHADKRGIPFAALCGDEEMGNGRFTLKDLATGTQDSVDFDILLEKIR